MTARGQDLVIIKNSWVLRYKTDPVRAGQKTRPFNKNKEKKNSV